MFRLIHYWNDYSVFAVTAKYIGVSRNAYFGVSADQKALIPGLRAALAHKSKYKSVPRTLETFWFYTIYPVLGGVHEVNGFFYKNAEFTEQHVLYEQYERAGIRTLSGLLDFIGWDSNTYLLNYNTMCWYNIVENERKFRSMPEEWFEQNE